MRVKPALAIVVLVLSAGCASVSDRNPVPLHLMPEASVPGMGPIRYWGDEMPKEAVEELKRKIPSMARLAESPPEHGRPVVNFLAISSGGAGEQVIGARRFHIADPCGSDGRSEPIRGGSRRQRGVRRPLPMVSRVFFPRGPTQDVRRAAAP